MEAASARLDNYRHLKISLPVKIALCVLLVLSVIPKIFNTRGFHYYLDLDVYREPSVFWTAKSSTAATFTLLAIHTCHLPILQFRHCCLLPSR